MKLRNVNENYPGSHTGGFRSMPKKIMPDREDIYDEDEDHTKKMNDKLLKMNKEKPILKEPNDNLKPISKYGPS